MVHQCRIHVHSERRTEQEVRDELTTLQVEVGHWDSYNRTFENCRMSEEAYQYLRLQGRYRVIDLSGNNR